MRQRRSNSLIMRKQIVKTYLTDALFQLLEKYPLEKITIQKLIQTAGVCRASFYRNYLTMNQIIDEYLNETFTSTFEKNPINNQDMEETVLHIFQDIEKHKKRLIILNKRHLLYNMNHFIYESSYNQIVALNVLNNKYQPYFFAGASSSLIQAWIDFNFDESPEEMTKIFFKSLAGYMQIP